MLWLLDFNGTLVQGEIAWALEHAFPTLVRNHQLPYDAMRLETLVCAAQEQGSRDVDPRQIVHDLFAGMGWPAAQAEQFMREMATRYAPQVHPDALDFLQRINASGQTAVIVSNSARTPALANKLGLAAFVQHIFTPESCPGSLPKPHPSLWDCVRDHFPAANGSAVAVVGDDPWCDGAFAEKCGLSCWIVDRSQRFSARYGADGYRWVTTLGEIPLHPGG